MDMDEEGTHENLGWGGVEYVEMFYIIMFWVVVTWLSTIVKIHQSEHL